jgi:hypothetical protein
VEVRRAKTARTPGRVATSTKAALAVRRKVVEAHRAARAARTAVPRTARVGIAQRVEALERAAFLVSAATVRVVTAELRNCPMTAPTMLLRRVTA